MQELSTLIDKASVICGSDSALARRLGVHQPDVAQMRSGKRTITPETAAELADIVGSDPLQAMAAAVLARSVGTRRESTLKKILGGALALNVIGLCLLSNVAINSLTAMGSVYYV